MTDTEFKIALNERLCDLAELFLYQYNPCGKIGSKCISAEPNPCCENTRFGKAGCPFFNGNECKIRFIMCRHWLCEIAMNNTVPECVESLKYIGLIGRLYGLVSRPLIGESYVGKKADLERLHVEKIS